MLKIAVPYFDVINALLATDRLSEEEALDRRKVERAVAQVIEDFSERNRNA